MFIQPLRFTNWQGLRFAGKVISERDGNRIKIELTSPTWGELKKGDFMHAKCQFSSEAKHVVQDTIGLHTVRFSSRFLRLESFFAGRGKFPEGGFAGHPKIFMIA